MSSPSRLNRLLIAAALVLPAAVAFGDADLDDELTQALEATPNVDRGKVTYNICATCHTPEGWGSPDGRYPQIAGQHPSVLIKQLADIRAGNRSNPEMEIFARENVLGGPQGIADVAAYVSTLPMDPEKRTGPGTALEQGKEVYEANCARCHGDQGEGDDVDLFPRVYDQHFDYLLRQLKRVKDGTRKNVYLGMVRRVQRLSEEDLIAVADYMSRLKPPPEKVAPVGWKNTDLRGPSAGNP